MAQSQSKWALYFAFATVPLVLVLGNSMLVPVLPDMAKEMKLSELQSSLVITLFSVTAGLFIPFIGYLSDRVRRKAVIVPALAIYGAAGIMAGMGALWDSYAVLIVSRIVQGLAAAGTAPIAMALAGDMFKDGEKSEALGLIEASNGAGKVISPILGSLLGLWTWYAPFFAFPFFCAGSLVAVLLFIKEPKQKDKPPAFKKYAAEIKSIYKKNAAWLFTAYGSGALGLFILFGVLFYLSDKVEKPPYSIDGVAKGGLLAIPLLGLVITAYTTGRAIKKNNGLMRKLMIVGLCIIVLSLSAAAVWHKNLIALVAFVTVSSIGTGLLLPCLNTMITGCVERTYRGTITAFYSSLRFFGVAAGPPLFSMMANWSVTMLFVILAALSAASFWCVYKFIHPSRQAKEQ